MCVGGGGKTGLCRTIEMRLGHWGAWCRGKGSLTLRDGWQVVAQGRAVCPAGSSGSTLPNTLPAYPPSYICCCPISTLHFVGDARLNQLQRLPACLLAEFTRPCLSLMAGVGETPGTFKQQISRLRPEASRSARAAYGGLRPCPPRGALLPLLVAGHAPQGHCLHTRRPPACLPGPAARHSSGRRSCMVGSLHGSAGCCTKRCKRASMQA